MKGNKFVLEEVIKLTPGNIFWKNIKGEYLGCNDNVAKLLKLNSPKEIIGKTNHQLFDKELADIASKNDQQVYLSNETITFEEEGLDLNGNHAFYITKKTPIIENGEVIGLIGVSVDITDKKNAERLALEKTDAEKKALAEILEERIKAEKEREMRQSVMVFSGAIAHEQRTPLATLNIISTILKQHLKSLLETYQTAQENHLPVKNIPPQIISMLEHVGEEIREIVADMNNSIDQALKSLSHAIKVDLSQDDLDVCSINKCLREALEKYPYEKNEKTLIHWNCNGDFTFLGNRILFFNVINNLLKNAFEQIRKNGKGEIWISIRSIEKTNFLMIKDTAGGAPLEVMDNMFHGYITTKKKGTGIGLANCKLTMNQFGGDIRAQSVFGDYMEFVLSFPALDR